MRHSGLISISTAMLAALVSAAAVPGPAACQAQPRPALAREIPADVCIPDGFTGIALDYFDDFSWREFAALVRPAPPGRRGVPAAGAIAGPGPRVFETYKALWEIFPAGGALPEAAFDRYGPAKQNPCEADSAFGDIAIGSASGIDDIGQAGIGALDPPIVAQNGRYVRTLTLFN